VILVDSHVLAGPRCLRGATHRKLSNRDLQHFSDQNPLCRPAARSMAAGIIFCQPDHGISARARKLLPGNPDELQPRAQAVITELNKPGGEVTIDLVPGGTSHLTFTSHRPLPGDAIRHASAKPAATSSPP
jgi:hypothetical protein